MNGKLKQNTTWFMAAWQKLLAGTWQSQYLVWTKEGGKAARLLMTTFFYCSAVLII